MKKIMLSILALSLLTNTAFASFPDVNEDTYYKTAIEWMEENGVINGNLEGYFEPDNCVNRAEFLKMLYKTLSVDVSVYEGELFYDVPAGEWYAPYVIAGLQRGTVAGFLDDSFKPTQCVTRGEAIKMAILEFNDGEIPLDAGMYPTPYDIAQETGTPFWEPHVRSALSANVLGLDHFETFDADWPGTQIDKDFRNPTYNFEANSSMSRKEVAEMLYRLKAIKDNNTNWYNDEIAPNTLIPTPNGEGQSEAEAIYGIKEAMAEKHAKEVEEVTITITDLSMGYAYGGVIFAPGGVGQGGIFYAMEVDGSWTIVHDGQDAPTCTHLTELGFPSTVGMDQCY